MSGKRVLDTYMGKVHRLSHNPNVMGDGAFTRLMESLMWKESPDAEHSGLDFLSAKGFVVWRVPEELPEGREWPFSGQEGKLVLLGGNWRYEALVRLGYEKIPDEWVKVAKYGDGSWWSVRAAERFILIDNSPEGMSGENDFEELLKRFDEECLKGVGIDYADAPDEWVEERRRDVEEDVECGEHGEMDAKLQDFKRRREESRGNLEEILDMGFYLVVPFETHAQKMEFLEFLGERHGLAANRDVFLNGFALAEAMGKKIEYSGLKFPNAKPVAALQEMAYDGTAEGWEVGADKRPEGETEDEGEKVEDGSGLDGVM